MKIWRELLGYVKLIVIVVAITLVINNVVLINAKIPSPSMEKTLMVKDRLFGFRLAYGINLNLFGYEISEKFKDPERFDIVIFKYPDDESRLFIKRVIGLPGEVVEIKDGKVYIDGSPTPLDDSFIPEKMIGSYGPYTVPENCYFMLGDNRNDSKDSRSWKNKFVRFDQIVGKVDGRLNNISGKKQAKQKERTSVLEKLHRKQKEIVIRSGKQPEQAIGADMERNRK